MKALLVSVALAAAVSGFMLPAQALAEVTTGADFNGDGYGDLAIGARRSHVTVGSNTIQWAGTVVIRYGSATGLAGGATDRFSLADAGGTPNTDDAFGYAVATGDFDGDGYDDVIVGAPYDRNEARGDLGSNAGSASVFYGSVSGITTSRAQLWNQDSPGVNGTAQRDDHFGWSVAAADINADGIDDVAIGVPDENIVNSGGTSVPDCGAVNVLYGRLTSGVTASGDQIWHQARPGIAGAIENYDRFGHSVAFGDLNGDGSADLIIGTRGEDVGTVDDAGAVNVILGSLGSAAGLTSSGNSIWTQAAPGIEGAHEEFDYFGQAVATGDFDGDGYDELVAGVPHESIGNRTCCKGAVNVIPGSSAGPTATGDVIWSRDQLGGTPRLYDYFGSALAVGDGDADGYDDLAVGAPYADVGTDESAGSLNVIFGSATGLTASGSRLLTQSDGISRTTEPGDRFGFGLAWGAYDGDGFADLAVGAPGESAADVPREVGAITVFAGSASGPTNTGGWHNQYAIPTHEAGAALG